MHHIVIIIAWPILLGKKLSRAKIWTEAAAFVYVVIKSAQFHIITLLAAFEHPYKLTEHEGE